MTLMYHLVFQAYFDSLAATTDYVPSTFERDGFVHCTDDPIEMARVANRYYADEQGPHLYLYIDKDRVNAPIRYEDAENKYPHVYGPLNRDAVVAVRLAARDAEGHFLPPL